jgi:hypothetical protein
MNSSSSTEPEVSKCTTFMAYELRSTGTLQSLGCIPRSPSPVPDAGLMMRRNNEMMLAMHQELRELRVCN